MPNFIFGIDGGGTKSHMAVFDRYGQCVGAAKYGPLNHEIMAGSYEQLKKEFPAFIQKTLAQSGAAPADIDFAVMGIAGVDTVRQRELIAAMVRESGLSRFILCNDAFLGVPAGCPGGVGICAINGTGSTMAAIDYNGVVSQVGGIGEISNDCGGSFWYGMKLLGAVYGELFKKETKTVMTGLLFDRLGITQGDDYVEKITGALGEEMLTAAELNRLVFKAAGGGDEAAIRILDESANHYAGGIAHLASHLFFPPEKTLHITLAGSVFTKEKVRVLPDLLAKKVGEKLPGRPVMFHTLKTVPVAGAVYWAGRKAGWELGIEEISAALHEAGL